MRCVILLLLLLQQHQQTQQQLLLLLLLTLPPPQLTRSKLSCALWQIPRQYSRKVQEFEYFADIGTIGPLHILRGVVGSNPIYVVKGTFLHDF